jgi:glycerophosphoryl diester phosphodiesterase
VDAAENSLAGLRLAAGIGADGVEVDLRVCLDQRPFIMHDWTLRRTANFPLPLELTPSFLVRHLHLKGSDEYIPSLGDVLDALPPGLLLAVDVKTPWAVIGLLRQVRRRRMEDRVLVWCTSGLAVRYVAKRAPAVEVAYLKDVIDERGKRAFLSKARRIGAKAISAHWLAIDPAFVNAAHALGLKVYSYHLGYDLTPDKLNSGLDGLITDFPVTAREAYATLSAGA